MGCLKLTYREELPTLRVVKSIFFSEEKSSAGVYRYGFQGQEKDDEIKGAGNSINYKYRMHDPRLGRFFAVDPLAGKFPHWSPYQFAGNQVIHAVELEGLESSYNLNYNEFSIKVRDRKVRWEDIRHLNIQPAGQGQPSNPVEGGQVAVECIGCQIHMGANEILLNVPDKPAIRKYDAVHVEWNAQLIPGTPVQGLPRPRQSIATGRNLFSGGVLVPTAGFVWTPAKIAKETANQVWNINLQTDRLPADATITSILLRFVVTDANLMAQTVADVQAAYPGVTINTTIETSAQPSRVANNTKINYTLPGLMTTTTSTVTLSPTIVREKDAVEKELAPIEVIE